MMHKLFVLVNSAIPFVLCACAGLDSRPDIPQVSTQDVVSMSKQGRSTECIIGKIQQSGTVYILTSSQIVQFAKEGVPDPVLDHMQQTYIKAVERNARRIYSTRPQFVYVPVL